MIQKHFKSLFQLFSIGFIMGTADLVPGVSGGTIAFIFGVYEKLIDSIKLVSGEVVRLVLRGKIGQAIKITPWSFLVPLVFGILTAVVSLSSLLGFLLLEHPVALWSFFLGLVLVSIFQVSKRIKKWNYQQVLGLVATAALGYYLVGLVPVNTPANLPAFFFSGAVAICAMILPGVSGSFLLLIMGKYAQILQAVEDHNFLILGTVALGAIFGLAVFSRVLSVLFHRYHDTTVAVLIGFMIGSLRKIWPWKEVLVWGADSHGEPVALVEKNIIPETFSMEVIIALALVVLGAWVMMYLEKLQFKK